MVDPDTFRGGDLLPATERVREIFLVMERTFKARRLYHEGSATLAKIFDELETSLGDYLREQDELWVEVAQRTLRRGDTILFDSDRPDDENLPFLLYIEGIRELGFSRGVSRSELIRFFDLLTAYRTLDRCENDLVTLLWEADFDHVHCRAVEELLGEELGDEERARLEALEALYAEVPATSPLPREVVRNLLELLCPRPSEDEAAVAEKTDLLRREIAELGGSTELIHLFRILLEIVGSAEDFKGGSDALLGILTAAYRGLLRSGEVATASEATTRLVELARRDPAAARLVEAFFDRVLTKECAAEVAAALNRKPRLFRRDLVAFFDPFPSRSAAFVCQVMRHLAEPARLRDALRAAVLKRPAALAAEAVDGPAGYLKEILHCLATLDIPGRDEIVRKLTQHANPEVRCEAIRTLAQISGFRNLEPIASALADPSLEVRSGVLEILRRQPQKGFTGLLEAAIRRKDFHARSGAEKLQFLHAYAAAAGSGALPLLERLLRRPGWLRGGPISTKECAARALAELETSGAIDLLLHYSHSGSRSLRGTCRQLLREKGLPV